MSAISYVDAILGAEPSATIAKVTLILTVTGLSAIALRRGAAAVRHVIWLAGLVSAASMMVLTPVVPGIPLVVATGGQVDRGTDRWTGGSVDRLTGGSLDRLTGGPVDSRETSTVTTEIDRGSRAPSIGGHEIGWSSLITTGGLLAFWAIGAAVVLGRAIVGHVIVARLVQRARVANDADLVAASDHLGARNVRLLVSARIATPITTGSRRPVVLLPESAADWSAERRRIVFLHELAHVVRGDYAAQAIATIAAAVLWFHPFAWLAIARLKAEAEHAADDVVLSSGTTGVVYASHLLELARAATPLRLSAAVSVGVVRSSRVERRFLAILDERRSRRGFGWRSIGTVALASAVVMSPLAGVRTVARAMTPRVFQGPPAPPLSSPPVTQPTRTALSARVLEPPRAHQPRRSDVDSTLERSVSALSGARLNLDLPTGGGIIVHGWDSPRIDMHAALGGEDWRDVRIDLTRDGRDAELSSTFSSGGTHGTALFFEIWVPRETNIQLASAGGSVAIDHLTGDVRGHTGGGDIEIRNGRGNANLSTGGGEITVIDSRLNGTINTGWGRVHIENNSGDLQALTNGPSSPDQRVDQTPWSSSVPASPPTGWVDGGGSITNTNMRCVSVSTGLQPYYGSGSVSKDGGGIHVSVAAADATVRTGGGRIVVDSTEGGVVAVTGGGDIELKAATGNTTVSTGAGDVSVRVSGSPAAPHNVDVCDGRGRVTLDLPRELDATIELETAYTNNAPRRTNIESDFDLSRSETHEWDDRFGTPRKFVRAVGKVGAGTYMIRVSTVNGDIVVHRR